MSIGKPKNEPIDLNGLMNEIENDHRITVESDAVDKRIEELRVAQTTDEIVMKRHFEKQAQAMEAHERRISSILSRNQGFWVSDFWAKVFCWVILVCFLLIFISYYLKTRL